jgi:meso-butanediol dehydrogenase/(S,S)-butanediol dehydrogenase/diacetyl reductase
MNRLDGKVALITGTGGGQGRAAAQIFAREGAKVVGCDLKVEGNEETARLVEAEGGTFVAVHPLDLADRSEAERFVDVAIERFGGIDILYNNASAQRFSPFPDITAEEWRFTMQNDLEIVFPVTQYAWKFLVERGGGSVINTSSGSAIRGTTLTPTVAHATAKSGVLGFTIALAAEGVNHGIRVNAITPGLIDTPVVVEHLSPEQRELGAKSVPIGRMGKPEEIAYYALFLASDEAGFVTGTTLSIDGGQTVIM